MLLLLLLLTESMKTRWFQPWKYLRRFWFFCVSSSFVDSGKRLNLSLKLLARDELKIRLCGETQRRAFLALINHWLMHCSIFIWISGLSIHFIDTSRFSIFVCQNLHSKWLNSHSNNNRYGLNDITDIASKLSALRLCINIGVHFFDYLINFNLVWMRNELQWKKKWHRFPCQFLDIRTNKQTNKQRVTKSLCIHIFISFMEPFFV